VMNCKR